MIEESSQTDFLLDRVRTGDEVARQWLLQRYRDRLRRMVAVRIDRRLSRRLDPSDIVQETLVEAARKLDEYLANRPLPFYPWIHRLAKDRLAQANRRHLGSIKREVSRELSLLSHASTERLLSQFATSQTTPSGVLQRLEQRQSLFEALERLSETDREVLVMRYLENLRFGTIAAVLGITEGAAKVRHLRALDRIRKCLNHENGETCS
ncbi:sigma-70 family RNA polymerase sigma factor [Tautonia rosea]|uniref:sigma-70 family RNA polymerase sigma factor n=1 Tax=Tautonia rosea TaxID=2728037 RepID=UPI001472AF99|nr:sigma-70 family RNA polymerase sigma factor [Tautonia rosea]